MMHKILVVEDDVNISSDLKIRLQTEGFITEVIYDGLLAEKVLSRKAYDCVVLDINIPGKNGLEVCKFMRMQNNNSPVIMLTAFGELDDKVLGFEHGADDYLTKPFYFKKLLARIKSLIKRGPQHNQETQKIVVEDLTVDYVAKKVTRAGKSIKLTPRELEILAVLANARGNIVSKKELIKKIWNTQVEVNTNTIEVFINSIRNKIDKHHSTKLIHTQTGYGYYLSAATNEAY